MNYYSMLIVVSYVAMVKGYLPEALKMYTLAAEAACEQREIEHICLYEKGVYNYMLVHTHTHKY